MSGLITILVATLMTILYLATVFKVVQYRNNFRYIERKHTLIFGIFRLRYFLVLYTINTLVIDVVALIIYFS